MLFRSTKKFIPCWKHMRPDNPFPSLTFCFVEGLMDELFVRLTAPAAPGAWLHFEREKNTKFQTLTLFRKPLNRAALSTNCTVTLDNLLTGYNTRMSFGFYILSQQQKPRTHLPSHSAPTKCASSSATLFSTFLRAHDVLTVNHTLFFILSATSQFKAYQPSFTLFCFMTDENRIRSSLIASNPFPILTQKRKEKIKKKEMCLQNQPPCAS